MNGGNRELKDININGDIKQMTFEECYLQFKPLRWKLTNRYIFLPMDAEDVAQLIDTYFWSAYESYKDTKYNFSTIVYMHIIQKMTKVNRGFNTKMRQAYKGAYSINEIISVSADKNTEYQELIVDINSEFDDVSVLKECVNKTLSRLDKQSAVANKLLIKGFTQREVAEFIGVNKTRVSRYKCDFIKKLEHELSA